MSTEIETPKTDSLTSSLKQLPNIGEGQIPSMVAKVKRAEMAMKLAEESYSRALRDLADDLVEDGDGWTFDEIWLTDLRGNAEIIKHLRSIGKDKA